MINTSPNKNINVQAVRLLSWLLALSLVVLVLDLPKPKQVAHAATNMLIFWDGAAAPGGWTVVSESLNPTNPFYQKMIRGADLYADGALGSDTHVHTISWVSSVINLVLGGLASSGSDVASDTHEHNSLASSSMGEGTLLPPYRELQIISCDAGTSCTIPDDAIAIFDAAPTGGTWTRYSAQDNKFIRGGPDGEATGGADTHTEHANVIITTGGPSSSTGVGGGSMSTGGNSTHTHSEAVAATTTEGDHTPLNVDILLYQNTSGGTQSIPDDMIAMFNGAPGGGWGVISQSSGGESETVFYHRFLEAKSNYAAEGGGAATHTHDDLGIPTGGPSATATYDFVEGATVVDDPGGEMDHTHLITVSFGEADNLPAYIDVIIAKKLVYTPATENWRWFDAEDTAAPNTTNGGNTTEGHALANEDTQPTNTRIVYKRNAIKLRIVIDETAGVGGTDVKYKLQYDTNTNFASATDVAAQGGTGALWRYYNGDNVADDATVTEILSTAAATDPGRHNEDAEVGLGAGKGSDFSPSATTDYEHEFTFQNYNGAVNTVYYFRLQYMKNSRADGGSWATVALGGGEAYPNIKTSAANDLEVSAMPANVSLGSYTKGSGGTLQYVFQASEEIVFWDKRGTGVAYDTTVNSMSLVCADPVDTIPGTDITWTSAAASLDGSFASDTTGFTGNDGETLDSTRNAYQAGTTTLPEQTRRGGFFFLPTIDLANLNIREICNNYTGTLKLTII